MLKLFVIYCLTASAFAWLAPERCAQNTKIKINVEIPATKSAETVSDIGEITTKQHDRLIEAYKNHQFIGVPTKRVCPYISTYLEYFEIHAPYNCTFYTYAPRLLSSVSCRHASCSMSHTVSTVDTYEASEGYNWGVKASTKANLLGFLEAGFELSTGGTYSCTYTKGKTVSDLVECSDSSGENGELQLFNVRSDMMCDFGKIKFERELREGQYSGSVSREHFTEEEDMHLVQAVMESLSPTDTCSGNLFALDIKDPFIDGIVEKKLAKLHPLYNPLTDMFAVIETNVVVVYYKRSTTVQDYRRIIPFTNEDGDSVYQYACIKTSS